MSEDQNIEYKQSWHDDHLKIICGFANAYGGKLFIGKDDSGKSIGVTDFKTLLENLPNKIKNHLGITANVSLFQENKLHLIEITIPSYSVAISLRGRYYQRSGSVTTELTGTSLSDFLIRKSGRTWDDLFEDRASIDDLDMDIFVKFLNAAERSGRITVDIDISKFDLLEKFRLIESSKIKRAAIILFGKDPGKFYPSISVKIGRFAKTDDDLKFQEVIEGNLLKLLSEVPEILNYKFFTKPIDFEGLQRIEKGEYPTSALREMLLNALVHKNYLGAPIQIRVYDDKFSIWNEGLLPEGLSFEALKRQHPSRPRNPLIADVCFKGGYIDAWGRGTLKIINSCREANLPEPEMVEIDGGFLVTIFKDILSEEQLEKLGLNKRQINAVLFVKEKGKITNKEYRKLSGLSDEGSRIDLNFLVDKQILSPEGKGRSAFYVLKLVGD